MPHHLIYCACVCMCACSACVCVCVCVCAWAHMCTQPCGYMYRLQVHCGMPFSVASLPYILRTGLSLNVDLATSAMLTGHQDPGINLCLPPWSYDYKCTGFEPKLSSQGLDEHRTHPVLVARGFRRGRILEHQRVWTLHLQGEQFGNSSHSAKAFSGC